MRFRDALAHYGGESALHAAEDSHRIVRKYPPRQALDEAPLGRGCGYLDACVVEELHPDLLEPLLEAEYGEEKP